MGQQLRRMVNHEHLVQQEKDHRQGAKVNRLVQIVARFVHRKVPLRPCGRRHAPSHGETVQHKCANRDTLRTLVPEDLDTQKRDGQGLREHRHRQDGGKLTLSNEVVDQPTARCKEDVGEKHWHGNRALQRVLRWECDLADLHHGLRQHGKCVQRSRIGEERRSKKAHRQSSNNKTCALELVILIVSMRFSVIFYI